MSININSNINDYDRIAIKCIKESLLLEKGSGDISEFKLQLQNLMTLNQLPEFQSDSNTELLNLIEQLYKLHTNKTSNILLFFYGKNCKSSSNFVGEWQKIKVLTNSMYKMIAINGDDPKYKNLCKTLNVYQYPTIKYISNNKITDYLGNMNSDEIIKTLNL